MKSLYLFLFILVSNYTFAQTLYYDENNVKLSIKISKTENVTKCENDWEVYYTDKPINLWEVKLTFKNGSGKDLKPKVVGITSVNIIPSDGKVLDYCSYRPILAPFIEKHTAQILFFDIFWPTKPIVKAGEEVSEIAHLYIFDGAYPLLSEWTFGGYWFVDGSPDPNQVVNGRDENALRIAYENNLNRQNEENEKIDDQNLLENGDEYEKLQDDEIIEKVLGEEVKNKIENADVSFFEKYEECMENGNAKYYRDKLESASQTFNSSPAYIKTTQVYSWLTLYYSYECECETGSSRPDELLVDINNLVKTHNAFIKNSTFAPLKEKYFCKEIEEKIDDLPIVNNITEVKINDDDDDIFKEKVNINISDKRETNVTTRDEHKKIENESINNSPIERITDEMRLREDEMEIVNIVAGSTTFDEAISKLKQKNIETVNTYTLKALDKITKEIPNFPFSSTEIQLLLNGQSLKSVIKNYNLKASNKLAQNLGLDYNQTLALNIIATSDSKEEMFERLNQNNIQQISQEAATGIQKMLGETYSSLPITSNDINEMLNGNFESAVTNIKYNQDINNLSDAFGGDRQLATASYAAAEAISQAFQEKAMIKSDALFEDIKIYLDKYINSKKEGKPKPFSYIANFNDDNWLIRENKYYKPSIIDNNTLEIFHKEKQELDDLVEDDFLFAELNIANLNLAYDFKISFELGHLKTEEFLDKKSMPPFIGLYMSETNKLNIDPYSLSFRYNFTPILNQFSKTGGKGREYFGQTYPKIYKGINKGYNSYGEDRKEYRRRYKKRKNHFNMFHEHKKNSENNWFYVKYDINKVGEKIFITCIFNNDELNQNTELFTIDSADFIFLDSNKIFFGSSSSFFRGVAFYKLYANGRNKERVRIRNFKFNQL